MTVQTTKPRTFCPTPGCGNFAAGHHVHTIQAKRIGQKPWGWRDVVVVAVEGEEIVLSYVAAEGRPVVWHHRPGLAEELSAGEPVRLHEEYHVLGTATGWYSVEVSGGIGPVPAPAQPELWGSQMSIAIVDLGTGVALPTDRPDFC